MTGPLDRVSRLTRKGAARARSGHPWVYRDDVASAEGDHGEIVRVEHEGRCLGSAFLSLRSKIALRWIERSESPAPPDEGFWMARVESALARRASLAARTDAYRVVHDAADGIPGLVVDRYGPVAVLQTTIAGTEALLPALVPRIIEVLGATSAVARNDLSAREKEGLPREVRVLAGECPDLVWVHEDGPSGRIEFPVDPRGGQKTGAFLDQRENRWCVAELARGSVLDAFSYTGLFSLHAARRAAETLAVDTSLPALGLLEKAAARAAFTNVRALQKNVFELLKEACAEGRRFDVVILDPPAFAKSRAEIPAAIRGYREINRRAMSMVVEGGVLATCSCSYNLGPEGFEEVLRDAAADARAEFRVLQRRVQASDHPVLLRYPESGYLKCIILERVSA